MTIKLQNTITGQYFANGAWDSDNKNAQKIEKDSPEHIVIRHTWEMAHTTEVSKDVERGREMMAKADKMRHNASTNRATYSRNTRVQNMMIGRADALHAKALGLMFA